MENIKEYKSSLGKERNRLRWLTIISFLLLPLLVNFLITLSGLIFFGRSLSTFSWLGFWTFYFIIAAPFWGLGIATFVIESFRSRFTVHRLGIEYKRRKVRKQMLWSDISAIDVGYVPAWWLGIGIHPELSITSNDNEIFQKTYSTHQLKRIEKKFIKYCPCPKLIERAKEIFNNTHLKEIRKDPS